MEIISETIDAVYILTISNERIHNAFGHGMAESLLNKLNDAEKDPNIRVIVITGSGNKSFSTGHDLKEIENGAYLATELGEEPFLRPLSMSKPVIAAINGFCYAAAFILAISCDIRIASENAEFGSPGARLGMLPEGSQLARLPTILPKPVATEIMMTAAPLSAQDAFKYGFISRLVPVGDALSVAIKLAKQIADNAPEVVTSIKKALRLSDPVDYDNATSFEYLEARRLENTNDAKEGVRAFLEKRKPVFNGN